MNRKNYSIHKSKNRDSQFLLLNNCPRTTQNEERQFRVHPETRFSNRGQWFLNSVAISEWEGMLASEMEPL